MQASTSHVENEQWVIWNSFYGILDMVTISRLDIGQAGRRAWLDEPYDMVGPFDFDELEACGWIRFAACIVMSRQRWQDDQVQLRRESHKLRRDAQEKLFEEQAQARKGAGQFPQQNEKKYRQLLMLPLEGVLESSQIKIAYRRMAQRAHPDAGGNHEHFISITEARDALLARVS